MLINEIEISIDESLFSREDLQVVYGADHLSLKQGKVVVEPKKTVLIIDDDFHVRILLKELLERDFDILMAEDGEKGCYMANTLSPDLVLLDLSMPKIDGKETLARLRSDKRTATLPVIVLSATSSSATLMDLLHSGIDQIMVKPVPQLQLLNSVRSAIQRSEAKKSDANEKAFANSSDDEAVLIYDGKASSRETIRGYLVSKGLLSIECQTLKQFRKSLKSHCKILDGVLYDAKDEELNESFDIRELCDFLGIPCLSVEEYLKRPDAFEKLVRAQGNRRRNHARF